MKSLLLLLVFTCTSISYSQSDVITYYEYTADGYDLYADNKEDYSVIVELDFDLHNLKVVRDGPSEIVVPANTNRFKLVDLVTINVLKLYDFKHTAAVRKNDKAIERTFTDEPLVTDNRPINEDVVVRMSSERKEMAKQKIPEIETEKPVTTSVVKVDVAEKGKDIAVAANPSVKTPAVISKSISEVIKKEPEVAIGKPIKTPEVKVAAEPEKKVVASIVKTPTKEVVAVKTVEMTKPDVVVTTKSEVKKEVVSKPISEPALPAGRVIKKEPEVAIGKPIKTPEVKVAAEAEKKVVGSIVKTPAKEVVAVKTVEMTKPDVVVTTKSEVKKEIVSKPISEPALPAGRVTKKVPEVVIPEKKEVAAVPKAPVKEVAVKTPEVAAVKPIKKPKPKKVIAKKKETAIVVKPPVKVAPKVVVPKVAVNVPPKKKEEVVVEKEVEKPLPTYDTSTKFSAAYQYNLPFKKGGNYLISQGYFTEGSHAKMFALDFAMPEGTQVLAVREGMVVGVVQKNLRGCEEKNCEGSDNYILIQHPDGSFAKYGHLKQNSAAVSRGDIVAVDQMLAYSGNTGWSTAPSLHFEVYRNTDEGKKTYRTNFRVRDGKDYSVLMEQQYYARNYN